MEEKNTQSSTVIDVCLIGIRGELLAFLHRHSGGQTRIVRGRNSESQRGTVRWRQEGYRETTEASFGTMCWHPDPVTKRAGHETSTNDPVSVVFILPTSGVAIIEATEAKFWLLIKKTLRGWANCSQAWPTH